MAGGISRRMASGLAADRVAATLYGPAPMLRCSSRGRAGGDARAIEALAEIGRLLGSAIGSIANIFDPDVVIVGGGFGAAAGDLVLEPARERRRARRSSLPTSSCGSSRPSSATKPG